MRYFMFLQIKSTEKSAQDKNAEPTILLEIFINAPNKDYMINGFI